MSAFDKYPLQALQARDFIPYERLAESGAGVMVGHLSVPGLTTGLPASLDPAATRSIEETIAAMHAHGTTIVMTTHDLGQARRLADRVLFLHHGRLVEDAAAATFSQQPTSHEAAAFIKGELLW